MTRLQFAEQFGVHPEQVGRVSIRTWHRWQRWESIKAHRAAHDRVIAVGFGKSSADDLAMYNALALGKLND